MRCLVTGATGFIGGHVAERLASEGHTVRALVRPGSDVRLLREWDVELVEGDLCEPASVRRACEGIEAVVHCAAKVGEWGPIEEYRRVNVDSLIVLMEAALAAGVCRFVLVSSLGVYEARDHFGTDESEPLPEKHIDSYTQTKVEAERVAKKYFAERKLPLVVLRPGFVYGPRDRTVMPRILANLRRRLVTYFGSRNKTINNVYVGNVVEAVLLSLKPDVPLGEAFNITDGRTVTKKVFFERIADLAGLPRPLATWPMWFARFVCGSFERIGRMFRFAPVLNNARLKFMGLNLDYSIEKARRVLGYNPSTTFEDGMQATIDWLRREGKIEG